MHSSLFAPQKNVDTLRHGTGDFFVPTEVASSIVSVRPVPLRKAGYCFMTPTSLLDEIRRSRPEVPRGADSDFREFTGERFLPGYSDGSMELYHLHRYSFALPFVVGKSVLDVACGEGYGSQLMAQVAGWVTGVDIDQEVIETARKRYARPNLLFKQGTAGAVPVPDNSADVVVSFETLEHLSDQASYWSEVKRVLRKDGILIISSPNRDVYNQQRTEKNAFHVHELTHLEFASELALRFKHCQLYSQEIVFGSSLEPVDGAGTPLTTISIEPNTGVLNWNSNDGPARSRYLVAIASEELPFVPERSLYTGNYPHDAMASLAGGIEERNRLIRELKSRLIGPQNGNHGLAWSSEDGEGAPLKAKRIAEELTEQLDALTKQRDQAVLDAKRASESLAEQDQVIQAMKTLLDECTHRAAAVSAAK